MTAILETATSEEQAGSDGRFFESIDPWVLEKAKTLPDVKSASEEAAKQLATVDEIDIAGWRRNPAEFPHIDALIVEKNTYEDHASLVVSPGRTAVRGILRRPPKFMENIGQHSYWTTWIGERAVLSTTDDTGDPYINFAEGEVDINPDNGVRIATPIDYARLLVDIAIERSKLTEAA